MNISFLHNANSLTEERNDTKEFDNSNMSFESQERKNNLPLARQKLLTSKPNAGETIKSACPEKSKIERQISNF